MTTLREACKWQRIRNTSYYRKECGGLVILMLGKFPGLKCVCGKNVA